MNRENVSVQLQAFLTVPQDQKEKELEGKRRRTSLTEDVSSDWVSFLFIVSI